MRKVLGCLLALCLLIAPSRGSVGDRSLAYRQCIGACRTTCHDGSRSELPLPLRVTFWTCEDDCSYQCMHNLTNIALTRDLSPSQKLSQLHGLPPNRVVQYHGKWPFYRFMGLQEPMSVLFSAGNLYMHFKYGRKTIRQLPPDFPKPLLHAFRTVPIAGINLWVWSMVFHTRDKKWTEKLDYFSAALSILCNLYYAIIRITGWYAAGTEDTMRINAIRRRGLVWVIGFTFLCHISYLIFWKFDYSYNMMFNVFVGLLHNLLWTTWTISQLALPKSGSSKRALYDSSVNAPRRRAPHYLRPAVVLTVLSSLTALELFDFPAILRCLDAHALWHAATIPVIKWWYDSLLIDAWWICDQQVYKTNKARS